MHIPKTALNLNRMTFSKHGCGNAGYVLDSQLHQIFRNHAVQDKVTPDCNPVYQVRSSIVEQHCWNGFLMMSWQLIRKMWIVIVVGVMMIAVIQTIFNWNYLISDDTAWPSISSCIIDLSNESRLFGFFYMFICSVIRWYDCERITIIGVDCIDVWVLSCMAGLTGVLFHVL